MYCQVPGRKATAPDISRVLKNRPPINSLCLNLKESRSADRRTNIFKRSCRILLPPDNALNPTKAMPAVRFLKHISDVAKLLQSQKNRPKRAGNGYTDIKQIILAEDDSDDSDFFSVSVVLISAPIPLTVTEHGKDLMKILEKISSLPDFRLSRSKLPRQERI